MRIAPRALMGVLSVIGYAVRRDGFLETQGAGRRSAQPSDFASPGRR